MFTKEFDYYVWEGDSISCTVDGFDCMATLYRDHRLRPARQGTGRLLALA